MLCPVASINSTEKTSYSPVHRIFLVDLVSLHLFAFGKKVCHHCEECCYSAVAWSISSLIIPFLFYVPILLYFFYFLRVTFLRAALLKHAILHDVGISPAG